MWEKIYMNLSVKKCIHIYLAKYTGVTCMIGPRKITKI